MKNFTLYIAILILGLTLGSAAGQEAGSYQHYKINHQLIKPGATGDKDGIAIEPLGLGFGVGKPFCSGHDEIVGR